MESAESSQGIHPERFKSFVRHVCVVAKRHRDREEARAELQNQIKRLKRFSSKKREMDEELRELDRKISLVLEKEIQLLGIGKEESAASKELMQDVAENRERARQISNSINEIRSKLDSYINMKMGREKRIAELECKIRARAAKKKDIPLLRDRLRRLEGLYHKLKQKGVDASRIESRIEGLKLRLSFS